MSGPAAGVIATKELMKIIKINRAISFDMGGTSTDVSLIEKEERITKEAKIDGFAIKLPMIEIKTVGSGGGSIAWLDRLGILHVGPESQGANPGPACYMKGGRLATVTDANLILGRLNADMFLAGKIKLDIKGAYNAIAKLGRLLHKSPLKIAEAIIKVANSNMARAIRVISVEKGYDPREFSLIAFGGAGPMHACELAMMLGIKHIIIPRYPGTFSALGMLMADITKELSKTLLIPFEDRYFYRIISSFERLTKTSLTDLKKEGININNFISKKMLDLRYKGQSYEIITPWQGSINKTKKEFNRLHEKLYGFSRDDAQIELVNVCVRIKIPSSRLTFTPLSSTRSKPKIFCAKNCVIKTKNLKIRHYLRDSFPRYYEIKGPALILEDHSTTFIPPEFDLYVDGFGNLILSHK
jgi:N-methylhydantoinase A